MNERINRYQPQFLCQRFHKSAELHGVMSLFVRRAEQLQGKRIEAILHGPVRPSAAHLSDWIGRRSLRRQEGESSKQSVATSHSNTDGRKNRLAAMLAPALFRRPDGNVEKDCGNRGLVAPLLTRSL